jgi:hypothetical protein
VCGDGAFNLKDERVCACRATTARSIPPAARAIALDPWPDGRRGAGRRVNDPGDVKM